jgi:type I restriction enzyme R subunit
LFVNKFFNKSKHSPKKNGTIDPAMLFESPLTDMNDQGLMGIFDDGNSQKIISIVERINENAMIV